MTLPPRPQLYQPLLTIPLLYGRWSTSGSDRGNAHFFTATSNTIEGTGEKKNKRLGITQVQKESYVTLCMCRLTLVWILAKLPQRYWNADSSLLDLLSLVWTLSHADSSLCCPVSTRHSRHPSPTPTSSSFVQLSSRTPLPLQVTPRSQFQNPLSGFAPKQTNESSAWWTTDIVLQQYNPRCKRVFFFLPFLIHAVYLCPILDQKPYKSAAQFLWSVFLRLFEELSGLICKWHWLDVYPYDEISAAELGFKEFSNSSEVHFSYFFLMSPVVWWYLLLILPSTCSFHFLQAF